MNERNTYGEDDAGPDRAESHLVIKLGVVAGSTTVAQLFIRNELTLCKVALLGLTCGAEIIIQLKRCLIMSLLTRGGSWSVFKQPVAVPKRQRMASAAPTARSLPL